MKVFFINLSDRKDRLEFILGQLEKLKMKFERVDAVLGKEIFQESKLFNRLRYKLENRQNLVPGEVGCAQSHINVWKSIIEKNLDYAVVLEDDVYINENLNELIADKGLISQFDYLKIDDCHLHDYQNINSDTLLKHDVEKYHGKIFQEYKGKRFSVYECDPVPYGTGGYIISQHAARQFLSVAKNMYYPIDLLPRYSSGNLKQGFTSHAFILAMDVADTNIGGRVKGIELSLLERLMWVLHKVFNRRRLRQLDIFLTKFQFKRHFEKRS